MVELGRNFSRGVLVRLVAVLVVVTVVLAANTDFITKVYLKQQLTHTGYIINGSIIVLFLLGIGRVIGGLLRYMREEQALQHFAASIDNATTETNTGIPARSLISQRFQTILSLNRQSAPINHAALASTLVARESTTISLPKFINNILILTGVFGTIISLSIALVGTSNILGSSPQEVGDMGMVIHGMSTALSTTITAIVCYLIYGYFYIKLTDAQTHVLSEVEQVTAVYLLPRYAHTPDNIVHHVAGLVKELQEVARNMRTAQSDYVDAGSQLHSIVSTLDQRVKPVSEDLSSIKRILNEGFRLPETDGD